MEVINEELAWPVKVDDCMWTLLPSESVHVRFLYSYSTKEIYLKIYKNSEVLTSEFHENISEFILKAGSIMNKGQYVKEYKKYLYIMGSVLCSGLFCVQHEVHIYVYYLCKLHATLIDIINIKPIIYVFFGADGSVVTSSEELFRAFARWFYPGSIKL